MPSRRRHAGVSATGETFIASTSSFSSTYGGTMVRFIVGPGPSRAGIYEIFTGPLLSGRTEIIIHRFFRPEC
jgi:hypothetical protein